MTKAELINKVKELPKNCAPEAKEDCNEEIKQIKLLLNCFDEDFDFLLLNAVAYNLSSGFPPPTSVLEKLIAIRKAMAKYVADNISILERRGKENIIKRKHIGLWIFIGVICAFALAAIVCAILKIPQVLNKIKVKNEDAVDILESLGAIFGFIDFVLGAIGFVWERITEIKGERLSEKASVVKDVNACGDSCNNSNDKALSNATDEFVKAYNKCVKIVQVGIVNKTTVNL